MVGLLLEKGAGKVVQDTEGIIALKMFTHNSRYLLNAGLGLRISNFGEQRVLVGI